MKLKIRINQYITSIFFFIAFITLQFFSPTSTAQNSISAKLTISNFYLIFFDYDYRKTPELSSPELKSSASFQQLLDENTKICDLYSTGICGWGADSDVYTNSQEADPTLSFESSGLTAIEIEKNVIQVRFNLFPGEPDEYYDRVITYQMVLEDGEYVVDDVLYGEEMGSSRERLKEENEYYLKNPDPDSKFILQQTTQKSSRP